MVDKLSQKYPRMVEVGILIKDKEFSLNLHDLYVVSCFDTLSFLL
ncbi:hypothetical protein LEP1GSC005_3259 [Leptospira santarosai str. ST188]|nr:hypothetical protein LEP1GSC005_3259 [Leptospira santarosai str. ST188]EMO72923.1 hypothetical protein LEP1GSC130_0882 [Leptospira santarosai str. 200403458]